ncbi:MAG: response regulator [Tahibacter sp.]
MYRILLIDDEPNILAALRRVINNIAVREFDGQRPEVVACTDPREAIERFDDESFDLVISDLRMPGTDGISLLSQFAARQPTVARLLMSGYADLDAIIGAVNEAQVYRFIAKPWHERELRLAITQSLQVRSLQLENQRLADIVRAQQGRLVQHEAELQRLESENPGITRLHRDETGAIFIDEDDL